VALGLGIAGTARADITTGLVVNYNFDGSYTDSASSGVALTASGNPQFVTGPSGFSRALQVDSSDYVTGPTSMPLPLGNADRTMAFRVYFPVASSTFCDAMSWGNQSANQQSRVFFYPNHSLYFSGWGPDLSAGTTLPLGTWKHVAVTVSGGSSVKFYVDGALVSSGTWTGGTLATNMSNKGFSVGNTTNGCADGAVIDDVRVYSRALSAADVSELAAYGGAAGIPTLSEWGMLVLAALLAATMVYAVRRRQA
jgi:hypothetical protein